MIYEIIFFISERLSCLIQMTDAEVGEHPGIFHIHLFLFCLCVQYFGCILLFGNWKNKWEWFNAKKIVKSNHFWLKHDKGFKFYMIEPYKIQQNE